MADNQSTSSVHEDSPAESPATFDAPAEEPSVQEIETLDVEVEQDKISTKVLQSNADESISETPLLSGEIELEKQFESSLLAEEKAEERAQQDESQQPQEAEQHADLQTDREEQQPLIDEQQPSSDIQQSREEEQPRNEEVIRAEEQPRAEEDIRVEEQPRDDEQPREEEQSREDKQLRENEQPLEDEQPREDELQQLQNQELQPQPVIQSSILEPAPTHPEPVLARAAELQHEDVPKVANYDFLGKSNVYTKPAAWLPRDAEVSLAKSFLKTQKGDGSNMYDHLSTIVMRVLEQRPTNSFDLMEMISLDIKRSKFRVEEKGRAGAFKHVSPNTQEVELAKLQVRLLAERVEGSEEDDGSEVPDVMELSKLWEYAGFSFGQEETYLLFLSLKKLAGDKQLKSVRLWGKILGRDSNYIVVEGDLNDDAADDDDEIANAVPENEESPEEAAQAEDSPNDESNDAEDQPAPVPIPKAKVKVTSLLSKEIGSGVNKYVYYVANHAGGEFTRLPNVIPECLQTSRKIRKYFTGRLNHQITSYPLFKSNEAQLLRCQIARISASTVVSPAGYYTFDPEDENADGGEGNSSSNVIMNTEYEGLSNDSFVNPSNWVHHVPYVLPQGRVSYENTLTAGRNGEEGEEGDDDEEQASQTGDDDFDDADGGPETGPALLTSISADDDNGDINAWSARYCLQFAPTKYSPVTLRSNRWPGAFVVAYNDKFANVYHGDGLKSLGNPEQAFILPQLTKVQHEYGTEGGVEELVEQIDPTVQEEQAYEDSLKANEIGSDKEGSDAADGDDADEKDEGSDEEEEEEA